MPRAITRIDPGRWREKPQAHQGRLADAIWRAADHGASLSRNTATRGRQISRLCHCHHNGPEGIHNLTRRWWLLVRLDSRNLAVKGHGAIDVRVIVTFCKRACSLARSA